MHYGDILTILTCLPADQICLLLSLTKKTYKEGELLLKNEFRREIQIKVEKFYIQVLIYMQ